MYEITIYFRGNKKAYVHSMPNIETAKVSTLLNIHPKMIRLGKPKGFFMEKLL